MQTGAMLETIRIPKTRIAVLVGKQGSAKKRIERLTQAVIEVNSATGEVNVESNTPYAATTIVRAIGRGFSPDMAITLLDDNTLLEVLKLEDYLHKGQYDVKKARVIGSKGRVREELAKKTECAIAITGKTISIIGSVENISLCRRAIEMLLEGASHKNVYDFIARKRTYDTTFEV